MLLIEQRIFLAICEEEKKLKAYYVTNDFEKIFDSDLDYFPTKLHGVNLLKDKKKFACAHKDGIIIYQCWDRISKREEELFMDEYDKYLHKEENPLIHTLIVEEMMSLFIPNAEIKFCVLMNGHSFAFNSLFLIKIWKYKKEEKYVKEEYKNGNINYINLKNIVLEERAQMQLAAEQEQIKNGRVIEKKEKNEEKDNNNENGQDSQQELETQSTNINNKFKRTVNPKQIKELITLKGHPKQITSLCSLRDGTLASGAKDKKIFIWDPRDQKIINSLEGHLGYVSALYQMNEGNLVSGDEFCNIIIWSKNLKYKVASIYQDGTILRFFQIISGELLSLSSRNQIKIWNFNRSLGKEKDFDENEIKKVEKEEGAKKKKSKKQKKKEKEMEKRYKLKDKDFKEIYQFIEDVRKEQEEDEYNEEDEEEEDEEEIKKKKKHKKHKHKHKRKKESSENNDD
jgi:WD40 repeat protein